MTSSTHPRRSSPSAWRTQQSARSVEQVHEDVERDRFFTPKEAMDYGLVDRVLEIHELTRLPYGVPDERRGETG